MWRMVLLLAAAEGCLQSHYGPACLLCPANSYCNGTRRQSCVSPPFSDPGSRDCYNATNVTILGRIRVESYYADMAPNPANASCGCYRARDDISVIMDVGRPRWIGGVATSSLDGAWVKSFFVSYSVDNLTWQPIGGLYTGNSDDVTVAENKFPRAVFSQFVRLHVVDYFLWPSLRGALLHANVSSDDAAVSTPYASTTVDYATTPDDTTTPRATSVGTTTHAPATTSEAHLSTSTQALTSPGSTTGGTTSGTVPLTTTSGSSVPCKRKVNMDIHGGCQYVCKQGTFNMSGACVGRPRHSHAPSSSLGVAVGWTRPRPWSRLHRFLDHWALESALPFTEMAIQTDMGPWMAWSRKPWVPSSFDVNASSHWALLPSPVRHCLHIRARVGDIILSFRHAAWTVHGLAYRHDLRVLWNWEPLARGDTSSVVGIQCEGGKLARVDVRNYSHTIFITPPQCGNVSDGLVWLRGHTELQGVDGLLADYLRSQCGRTALVGVQGPRGAQVVAGVEAVCEVN